jgi:hypothetical protein
MLGLAFIDILHSIWFLSIIPLIIGSYFIYLAAKTKKPNQHSFKSELLRDVGIAFIVAVIVGSMYELRMRAFLDTEKMEDVLSTVLKYNVPKSVWDEVQKNALRRDLIRRNVEIEFEVKPDESLPPNLAFLRIKYSYDLYRLKSNSADIEVQHKVVNDYNGLARFEHILITDSKGKTLDEYTRANDQEKKKKYIANIHLEPGYNYKEDKFYDDKAVHVVNERYEIINLPGIYSLGIPELVEGTQEKPIKVSVKVPDNLGIIPNIDTQWSQHTFDSEGKQGDMYVWTYNGVLLPGQFFDVLVSQPVTSTSATTP